MSSLYSDSGGVPDSADHGPHEHSHDASSAKLTRGTSCVLCQQRKVRCDKNKPCSNCVKAGVECRVVPPAPPRRRKKRLQEKDLVDRLKKYESLLRDNGVKFDSIDFDSRQEGEVDELENDFEGLKTTPEDTTNSSPAARDAIFPSRKWFSMHKEFRASERLLHDSDEEDAVHYSTIHKAFDTMFGDQDVFPFLVGGFQTDNLTDAHPPTIHIFQLWQIYIDNINPLLKITHIPTIQPQVIEASSSLDRAPKNIHALMFAIYVMAVTSLDEEETQKRFQTPKRELLGRYFAALQQSLVNAGFMRDRDLITLQAFVLYLYAIRWFIDPRQVFCMSGLAVRMAQQMGLHRDPEGHGLPAFEVEQRRRLWWTIVGYDRRLGEMTGSTVTALSSGCDTKMPLNVNDSDLHIERDEPPTSHSGPTEMMFALARMEIAMAVSSDSNRDAFNMNEKPGPPPPGGRNGPTVRIVGQEGPSYTLEGFCAHVEGKYLIHCDARIPLHFFTQTMTRQNLCKMRVISYLVRIMGPTGASILDDVERDNLFLQAIQMVEYDNVVQTSDSLKPFRWYAMHYFPFPAYMFLVHELRAKTSGPMVDRAWDAVALNHDSRGLLNDRHSPMHMAFGMMFLKAWRARVAAPVNAGQQLVTPAFITLLLEHEEKKRMAKAMSSDSPGNVSLGSIEPAQLPQPNASPFATPGSNPDNGMGPSPNGPPGPPGMSGPVSSEGGDSGDMDWSYIMTGMQNGSMFSGPIGGSMGISMPGGMGMSPMGGGMPGMGTRMPPGPGMGGPPMPWTGPYRG